MHRFSIFSVFLWTTCTAFQASLPVHQLFKVTLPSSTVRHVILSDEETEKILSAASDCADSECSIDDVSELVYELKEQEKVMKDRLTKVTNMIAHLQNINVSEERQTDEVRAFVKDMLRVFSQEKPLYSPAGFSGDVGKGATTAYDSLPPKAWKAADKK